MKFSDFNHLYNCITYATHLLWHYHFDKLLCPLVFVFWGGQVKIRDKKRTNHHFKETIFLVLCPTLCGCLHGQMSFTGVDWKSSAGGMPGAFVKWTARCACMFFFLYKHLTFANQCQRPLGVVWGWVSCSRTLQYAAKRSSTPAALQIQDGCFTSEATVTPFSMGVYPF